jgi:rhodanese-related sulfurtransferase
MACGARVDICSQPAAVELLPMDLLRRLRDGEKVVLVDVRELYEHRLSRPLQLSPMSHCQSVPLSSLLNAIPAWLAAGADASLVLFCRSGNRSAKAARALRRLGLTRTWSLAGGLALWPQQASPPDTATA